MKKVEKSVAENVASFLNNTSEDEFLASIKEFWDMLKIENPYLISIAMSEMQKTDNLYIRESLAHGIFVCYYAMMQQEEIETMNEDWAL